MLGFGGWVYVGSIGQLLLGRANSHILTTFLGSAALPYYEIPQRIFSQAHSALSNQCQFHFPMLATYGDHAALEAKRVENRLRWLMAVLSSIFMGAIAPHRARLAGQAGKRRVCIPRDIASLSDVPPGFHSCTSYCSLLSKLGFGFWEIQHALSRPCVRCASYGHNNPVDPTSQLCRSKRSTVVGSPVVFAHTLAHSRSAGSGGKGVGLATLSHIS